MDTVDNPISVLLISEYAVIRLGVLAYLNDNVTIQRVDQADSLQQAMLHLAENNIDVVIVDLSLLKSSGLSALRQLLKHDPGIKITVLSRNEKEPFITQCMENGALGYVSLMCTRDELIESIKTVYRNEKYLSHDVAYAYAISSLNKTDNPLSSLTSREYQVFTLLAKGTSIADVANPDKDDYSEINRQLAVICKEMILKDDDGKLVLHYLSDSFQRHVTQSHHSDMYISALGFINEQISQHKTNDCEKLRARYEHLKSYFEAHK